MQTTIKNENYAKQSALKVFKVFYFVRSVIFLHNDFNIENENENEKNGIKVSELFSFFVQRILCIKDCNFCM